MEGDDEKLAQRLKMIMKQFSGEVRQGDGEMVPEVAIKGQNGHVHCYSPSKKKIIRVTRGIKAFILSEELTHDKVLIYTFDGKIIEIEATELIRTGFD